MGKWEMGNGDEMVEMCEESVEWRMSGVEGCWENVRHVMAVEREHGEGDGWESGKWEMATKWSKCVRSRWNGG